MYMLMGIMRASQLIEEYPILNLNPISLGYEHVVLHMHAHTYDVYMICMYINTHIYIR